MPGRRGGGGGGGDGRGALAPSFLGNLVHTFDFLYELSHSRSRNTCKNVTFSTFLMDFQSFKGLKFHIFFEGTCPGPLAYDCLHVRVQNPPPPLLPPPPPHSTRKRTGKCLFREPRRAVHLVNTIRRNIKFTDDASLRSGRELVSWGSEYPFEWYESGNLHACKLSYSIFIELFIDSDNKRGPNTEMNAPRSGLNTSH